MRVSSLFAVAALGLAGSLAFAAEPEQVIRKTLQDMQPNLPIESIATSPMAGLYQVQLKGGRLLYASADGQFVMQGNLYQIKDGKPRNLTEQAETQAVAKTINAVPASELVVFSPSQPKTHITVFTDTDCPYCQKLHREVTELNRLGVEVRYAAFPRQGIGSPGYKALVNVWCAKDRREAMNEAKSGDKLADAQCENPVAKQFALGQMIGVQGTPAIILANGQMIPGYQPAAQLAEAALKAQAAVD